jgi:hypothetical protein
MAVGQIIAVHVVHPGKNAAALVFGLPSIMVDSLPSIAPI